MIPTLIPCINCYAFKLQKIPKYRICEENYPEHRIVRDNNKIFYYSKAMFTGLFEGATSNRAELDSK